MRAGHALLREFKRLACIRSFIPAPRPQQLSCADLKELLLGARTATRQSASPACWFFMAVRSASARRRETRRQRGFRQYATDPRHRDIAVLHRGPGSINACSAIGRWALRISPARPPMLKGFVRVNERVRNQGAGRYQRVGFREMWSRRELKSARPRWQSPPDQAPGLPACCVRM